MLAAAAALFAFYRLSIIPASKTSGEPRPLNWLPVLRRETERRVRQTPSMTFVAWFSFEKWLLAAVLTVAVFSIVVVRPVDFLGQAPGVTVPTHANYVQRIGLAYSVDFANVTRPYLFPYSLYILGLWYCIVLPVLLALIRSIRYDSLDYSRLRSALVVDSATFGSPLPQNAVALYRRKVLDSFEFIHAVAKRYALFMLPIIALGYIEEYYLSCSVLAGASDAGKWALLILSISSLGAVLYLFLRLHYIVRRVSLVGIDQISDTAATQPERASELTEATTLAEEVRKREGVWELVVFFRGAGIVGVVGGLLWTTFFAHKICVGAKVILPDSLVEAVANFFGHPCPP